MPLNSTFQITKGSISCNYVYHNLKHRRPPITSTIPLQLFCVLLLLLLQVMLLGSVAEAQSEWGHIGSEMMGCRERVVYPVGRFM